MRILLINPNVTQAVTDLVAAHVRRIAGPAVTVVPATGRFGARYIASRAAAAIAAHATLDAYAEHGAGYDAVYLACFGDPGLLALRDIAPVPVVGMAEAACREAARDGRRFGIVTGGTAWQPMLAEFVAVLGLGDRLAGIRATPATGGEIAREPDAALEALAAAPASRRTGPTRSSSAAPASRGSRTGSGPWCPVRSSARWRPAPAPSWRRHLWERRSRGRGRRRWKASASGRTWRGCWPPAREPKRPLHRQPGLPYQADAPGG